MYNDLFENFVVEKIKGNLKPAQVSASSPKLCILDIFGFEFTPERKLVPTLYLIFPWADTCD